MRPPLLFRLYTAATILLVPFFAWIETRKVRAAGFDVGRAHEKLGNASLPREGSGALVWFHAASVGESLSVLSLIAEMGRLSPGSHFLITSGTPTSARLVADRLPPRTVHQFAPLDAPGPVKRFLKHWRPQAAVFVESELWPQMLRHTRERGIRMVLVNARLSAKSRAAWKRRPAAARYVLECFDLILTQNADMAKAMVEMHAPADRVESGINLKALSAPLKQDPGVLAPLRTSLKGRPLWVAASTHRGEEELILKAHKRLLKQHPGLLLLLAPRHPERKLEIERLIEHADLDHATRSEGKLPVGEAVYLADTMGEMGNWYALSHIIFLGGSLKPVGGHNPFEVAQAGSGVLAGPEVFNFSETYEEMVGCGAARIIANETELADAVSTLLSDRQALDDAGRQARDFVRSKASNLTRIATRLCDALALDGAAL